MTEDLFKNFVEENRVDFESYQQDSQEMWMEIQKGIEQPVRPLWQSWVKVAAALVILAFSATGVLIHQQQGRLPLELREAENHYYTIIATKLEIVNENHDEVDDLIWEDLDLLDQAYAELKRDLKEKVDNEEVVQAMIENYRAKLEILDQILDEIENKEDETVEGLGI